MSSFTLSAEVTGENIDNRDREKGALGNRSPPSSRWPFGYLSQPKNLTVRDGTDSDPFDETEPLVYIEAPPDCHARYDLNRMGILTTTSAFAYPTSSHATNFSGQDCPTVDQMIYRRVRNLSTGDEGLAFWLIGHTLHNDYPRHNFTAFCCVTFVHFAGHFSYMSPAFKICSQISALKKVTFKLDMKQQPFFLETEDDSAMNLKPYEKSNSVHYLEVIVDPTECDLRVLENILNALFKWAEESLERLETVVFDLPVLKVCRHICERIVRNVHIMNLTNLVITESVRENTPKTVFFTCTATSRRNIRSPLLRKYASVFVPEGVSLQFLNHEIIGEALNDIHRLFPGVEESMELNCLTVSFARYGIKEGKLKETWWWIPDNEFKPNNGAKGNRRNVPVYDERA